MRRRVRTVEAPPLTVTINPGPCEEQGAGERVDGSEGGGVLHHLEEYVAHGLSHLQLLDNIVSRGSCRLKAMVRG